MPQKAKKNHFDILIGDAIRKMIDKSDYNQKELAEKCGIKDSSLCQMLSGIAPLAPDRFFQILSYLVPDSDMIDYLFCLFRQKISDSRLTYLQNKQNLSVEEKRELSIISAWNCISENQSDLELREEMHAMIDRLTTNQLQTLKPIVKLMVNNSSMEEK